MFAHDHERLGGKIAQCIFIIYIDDELQKSKMKVRI